MLFFFVFGGFKKVPVYVAPEKDFSLEKQNSFKEINLEAKAAYVFDTVKNEPIFKRNSYAQLPLASLTKIMTVVSVYDILPPEEKEKIFQETEEALVISSNEAVTAVAKSAEKFLPTENIVSFMNKRAGEIGLKQTFFLNATGLDVVDNIINGGYGSATDVAKMLVYAFEKYSQFFEATSFGEIDGLKNSNTSAASTTRLLASKTGFTDLTGGNLAVIFDAGLNRPIVAVVLGSTKEGRFSDIQKLIEATFKYLDN